MYENKNKWDKHCHRKAMDYFKEYLIVGGMPQAVLEYRSSRDFEKTDKIKEIF